MHPCRAVELQCWVRQVYYRAHPRAWPCPSTWRGRHTGALPGRPPGWRPPPLHVCRRPWAPRQMRVDPGSGRPVLEAAGQWVCNGALSWQYTCDQRVTRYKQYTKQAGDAPPRTITQTRFQWLQSSAAASQHWPRTTGAAKECDTIAIKCTGPTLCAAEVQQGSWAFTSGTRWLGPAHGRG